MEKIKRRKIALMHRVLKSDLITGPLEEVERCKRDLLMRTREVIALHGCMKRVLSKYEGPDVEEMKELLAKSEKNVQRLKAYCDGLFCTMLQKNELVSSLHRNPRSVYLNELWEPLKEVVQELDPGFDERLSMFFPHLNQQLTEYCILLKLRFNIKECATLCGVAPETIHHTRRKLKLQMMKSLPAFRGTTFDLEQFFKDF